MSPWQSLRSYLGLTPSNSKTVSGVSGDGGISKEKGSRPTPENQLKYLYQDLQVSTELRTTILEIRSLDKLDGRIKKMHGRMSRDITKGGLQIHWSGRENKKITKLFNEISGRCSWGTRSKLESDAKGLIKEGNLPIQLAVDDGANVVRAVRMPSETIYPNVKTDGTFKSPNVAYRQQNPITQKVEAEFPMWKLILNRLDPENYDDMGCLGRPYLDGCRETALKLRMTETDLVIRRRQRAPLRLAHTLEGATPDEVAAYKAEVESENGDITTDFYSNKKGGVAAVQGDANLGEIDDVLHLLDTFYAGSAAPRGLFGYTSDLARDVLEDMKKDYFEELDAIQDILANTYYEVFCIQLLLKGINPEAFNFKIIFSERQTMSLNQRADLALKYQAMGVPNPMIWQTAGLDPIAVETKREEEKDKGNPYPDDPKGISGRKVSITPNNAPKGESATSINN